MKLNHGYILLSSTHNLLVVGVFSLTCVVFYVC